MFGANKTRALSASRAKRWEIFDISQIFRSVTRHEATIDPSTIISIAFMSQTCRIVNQLSNLFTREYKFFYVLMRLEIY